MHERNIPIKTKPSIIILPPPKSKIQFLSNKDPETWHDADILGYAGKRIGGNRNFINLKDHTENRDRCVDFEHDVTDWQFKEDTEQILFGKTIDQPKVLEAQMNEIEKWKANEVFTEVEDQNQKYITVRWVVTEKAGKVKARLVARGFEDPDRDELRRDSPTCGKSNFRLITSILSSNKWQVHCLDVACAFLQGKPIDRDVYLKPPSEVAKPNTLWKLHKCVYGLVDASRKWYLKVIQEIEKLDVRKSIYDEAIFYWYHENTLHGIIVSHVDDFMWGGSVSFKGNIIDNLKKTLTISKEEDFHFKYLGLNVQQGNGSIKNRPTSLTSISLFPSPRRASCTYPQRR